MSDSASPPAAGAAAADLAGLQRPVRGRVTAAAALQATATVLEVTPTLVLVEIGRRLLSAQDRPVWPLAWLAVGLLLARFVLYAAAGLLSHLADADLAFRLRSRLVDQLAALPLAWFAGGVSARVRTTVQDDVATLHHAVAHARGDLASAVAAPVVVLGYLGWLDWRLALVTLALVVAAQAIRMRLRRLAAEPVGRIGAAHLELTAAVLETVRGIAVVKAFAGRRGASRFAAAAAEHADADEQAALIFVRPRSLARATVAPATTLAVLAAAGTGLAAAGWAGPTDSVDLVAFALLGVGLFEQLTPIYTARDQRDRARAAAHRVGGLLREPRQAEVVPEHALRPGTPLTVEFDDVRFSYPRGDADSDTGDPGKTGTSSTGNASGTSAGSAAGGPGSTGTSGTSGEGSATGTGGGVTATGRDGGGETLRGVTARLAPGTVTALVGPSGAGKSTLAMLLARFADVGGGAIRIGGTDLRHLDRDELYRHVGFLLQDVVLLHRTVRDNIALAVPDADPAAVEAAARGAAIHDRVLALPRGYASVVGEDAHLSGGEAQRIAIARILLARTPIVVLDEATAFADPDSEAAVQDALAELAAGRTLLVIAHRLYTITRADQILVLDEGRLVEHGRHEELLARGGRYAGLWRAQQVQQAQKTQQAQCPQHTQRTQQQAQQGNRS